MKKIDISDLLREDVPLTEPKISGNELTFGVKGSYQIYSGDSENGVLPIYSKKELAPMMPTIGRIEIPEGIIKIEYKGKN